MPLLEQHMSHPAIARVDKEALHPPDLAIDGMDPVAGSHICLPHGDNVFTYRPLVFRHEADADELGGVAGDGRLLAYEITAIGHRTLDQVELLRVVELVEL